MVLMILSYGLDKTHKIYHTKKDWSNVKTISRFSLLRAVGVIQKLRGLKGDLQGRLSFKVQFQSLARFKYVLYMRTQTPLLTQTLIFLIYKRNL